MRYPYWLSWLLVMALYVTLLVPAVGMRPGTIERRVVTPASAMPTAAGPRPRWVTAHTAMPMPLRGAVAAMAGDGRLYAVAGTSHFVEAYDAAANTWSMAALLPTARTNVGLATSPDGRLYAVGGCGPKSYDGISYSCEVKRVEVYTPGESGTAGAWTRVADLPMARQGLLMATDSAGRIYAMGGCYNLCVYTAYDVQVYDTRTGTWHSAARLPNNDYITAASVGPDGRIYVFGALYVQAYNPATNSWAKVDTTPSGLNTTFATLGADGRIYLTDSAKGTVAAYDTAKRMWSMVATLPISHFTGGFAVASGPDGRIYALGGSGRTEPFTSTVAAYGPAMDMQPTRGMAGTTVTIGGDNFAANAVVKVYWGPTAGSGGLVATDKTNPSGALDTPLAFPAPITATPGSYVVTVVDSVSRYPVHATFLLHQVNATPTATPTATASPTTSPPPGPPDWQPRATMSIPRRDIGSTTGPDGRIYAMGGCDATGCTASEAYDAQHDVWASLPANTHDADLAAAPGTDGRIYVMGGAHDYVELGNHYETVSNLVEAYDIASNSWHKLASTMLAARAGLGAVLAPNGHIYSVGGYTVAVVGQQQQGVYYRYASSDVEMYTFANQQWSGVAAMPTVRAHLGLTVGRDGRIYAIGGELYGLDGGYPLKTVEVYDPSANTWATLADLPTPRTALRAITGPDGRIYVFGGQDASGAAAKTMDIYNPATNTWTATLPGNFAARVGFGAGMGPDGRIYAFGGCCNAAHSNLSATDAYGPVFGMLPPYGLPGATSVITGANFAANALVRVFWGPMTPGILLATGSTNATGALTMPLRFTVPSTAMVGTSYAITVLDNRADYPVQQAFQVGNVPFTPTPTLTPIPTLTSTDTATPTVTPGPSHTPTDTATPTATSLASDPPKWLPLAPLPVAHQHFAAATGGNGRIYAIGGQPNAAEVDAYDPRAAQWSTVASLPVGRTDFAAATGGDGRVYVIGGCCSATGPLTSTEVYDPLANTWSEVAPLPTARFTLAAATGPDGRIYAIGGISATGPVTTVEAYDPVANSWSTMPGLPTPLQNPVAVTGADGRIYTFSTTGVDVYDPVAHSWLTGGIAYPTRDFFAAALGADGRIYVMGGRDTTGLSSAVVAYIPRTNAWQSIAPLTTARRSLVAVTGLDGRIYALGGADTTGALTTVEAYGPAVALSATQGAAGSTITVTGTNFAASASVSVYWDSITPGNLLAQGSADGQGSLAAPLTCAIPTTVATGTHQMWVVDNRSLYPITQAFVVTGTRPLPGISLQ